MQDISKGRDKMPRIVGVDIPKHKPIISSLTAIYGIGRSRAKKILAMAKIDTGIRAKDLTDAQTHSIAESIPKVCLVEGDVRRVIAGNIKRLISIGCYRGIRHRKGLPVRGQRTHTNARTRKGPRQAVAAIRPTKEKGAPAKAAAPADKK
jgi:small subunit ribosomal protein S13